ncbi:MAG: proton-conducting transporter membrane subunit [Candidatus Margulisiibacteriota bacterium]
MFNWEFLLDPLAFFFLALIVTIALPVLLYSFGYLAGKYSRRKIMVGQLLALAFVGSMLLVVSVRSALTFLVCWEVMTLLSYFLVMFEKESEKSIKAATIYIVMSHVGAAFIAAGIFLIHHYTGSFDLLAWHSAVLPAGSRDLLFFFFLIGFGIKAGIVPLHLWLPYAHPQAPSHISALMSGVMIKVAIYGLLRFVFFVLGIQALWWGGIVILLACLTCLVGIIYALIDNDLKTVLAYSSIENIGVIMLGLGAAMVFIPLGQPVLASLALVAALYHLINHAAFKSLLFLGAGSVYRSAGTKNLEKLGGLINKLPWTSAFFLIGALAIAALPPLNGFISEWLTLQVLFLGALTAPAGLKVILALCAAVLALTGGLTAACMVRAFGLTFLARPRSAKAEQAKEAPLTMLLGMGWLVLLIIGLSLGAVPIVGLLAKVAASAAGVPIPSFAFNQYILRLPGADLSPPLVMLALVAAFGLVIAATFLFFGRSRRVVVPTWDCGYYQLTPRQEYSATGFSKPFRIAFGFFLRPSRSTQTTKDSHYHVRSLVYEARTAKVFKEFFYLPFVGGLFQTAKGMKRFQAGSIQIYLSYILVVVLLLLLFIGRF